MADYNIWMHQLNASGTYDNLYPKTKGSLVEGTVASSDNSNKLGGYNYSQVVNNAVNSAVVAAVDKSKDIFSRMYKEFNASGQWVCPNDVVGNSVVVVCVGGGGGGSGGPAYGSTHGGGGGGSGYVSIQRVP